MTMNIVDYDVEAIKEVSKQDVIDFYSTYIALDGPKRAKASIQMNAMAPPTTSSSPLDALATALSTHLASTISLDVDSATLSPVFEASHDTADAALATLEKFLAERKIEKANVDKALKSAKEIVEKALEKAKADELNRQLKAEEFGEVLEDVVGFKATCTVTAGARPIKPLVEFEETNSRL